MAELEKAKFPFSAEEVETYFNSLLDGEVDQKINPNVKKYAGLWDRSLAKMKEQISFITAMQGDMLKPIMSSSLQHDLPGFLNLPINQRNIIIDFTTQAFCQELFKLMISDLDKG